MKEALAKESSKLYFFFLNSNYCKSYWILPLFQNVPFFVTVLPGYYSIRGSCHCENIMHTKRPNQNIMYTLCHSQYKQNWLLWLARACTTRTSQCFVSIKILQARRKILQAWRISSTRATYARTYVGICTRIRDILTMIIKK